MGSWVGSRGMNSSGLNKDGERVTCWKGEKIRDTPSPALKCPQPSVQASSSTAPSRLVGIGVGLGER